ncbi:hypothetical protein APR08_004667 [Nocardia amikacinitolerans]|nr:hypothetical protein [Nocardia amikacinitolerans]
MHADIESSVRIARLASEFDWTWKLDDLGPFCAAAGWEFVREDNGAPWIRTRLAVNRPVGYIAKLGQRVDYLAIYVTDIADYQAPIELARPALVDHFADLGKQLTNTLGAPARSEPGDNATLRWDLPKTVVLLTASNWGIELDLTRPGYQAEQDEFLLQGDD